MKKLFWVFMLFFVLPAQLAHAITVWYQPTPFPMWKIGGDAMPQNVNVVHILEGWLPSVYYGQSLQRDGRLQVGGWGDQYRTFIKFDLAGLPQQVDQAFIFLKPYSSGGSSTPVSYGVCSIISPWNLSIVYNYIFTENKRGEKFIIHYPIGDSLSEQMKDSFVFTEE